MSEPMSLDWILISTWNTDGIWLPEATFGLISLGLASARKLSDMADQEFDPITRVPICEILLINWKTGHFFTEFFNQAIPWQV